MAEERKAAAKSYKTPKGFFRLSGILNYIAPKAPSKPKAKDRKLYRYSGDGSGSASPITSPKKKERPGGDQRYRYSDELLSPPAAAKSPAKKKADQSYRLSDELLSPPACVKSPARKADQRYRLSDELLSPPAASQRKKGDKRHRHSNEPLSPLAPSGLLSPLSPGGKTKGAGTAMKRHDARTERKVAERATAQPKPKADRAADQNRRVNRQPDVPEAVEDFRSPMNLSQHRAATQQFTTLTDMTGIVSPPSKPGQPQQNKPTWQPRAPNAAIANMWLPQMLPVYQAAQRQREQQGQQQKVPPAAAATWSNTCWGVVFLVIIAAVMGALSLLGTLHIGEPHSTTDSDTETDEYAWNREKLYPGSSKHQPRQTAKTTPKVVTEKLPSSHVCVYRVSAEGRRVLPSVSPYGVSTLPFYSCNVIVYCCASLSGQYTPEPRTSEKDNFERLWNVTTAIRPWQQIKVLIGNGVDQSDRFKLMLENDAVAAKLARATASWCKKLGYSGVFFYWPRGHVFTWNATVALLIKLKRLFQTHQLTVGTVVSQPVDYGLVDDLERLADALGDTSILLRPPLYKKSDFYPKTFRWVALTFSYTY
ncbi:hypothetical protein HPB50_005859 [Hyalomma asiaticum]|uniref:Uncharacterized protein n=1 Tax=Hyalomma asiaticum TaxID=266040 RepID=A0ACB7S6R9_HYAAI|nr:hypothetical protein HPB50_005859 [Hyalomma asiaticum]